MSGDAERLLTRDFGLATLGNFFIAMVFFMLMTSMSGYAISRFQASDVLAGLAASSFVLGGLSARIVSGKLFDLVGRRRFLLISTSALLLTSLIYPVTGSLWQLIAVRVIHGMAFGATSNGLSAAVMTLIPTARRGEGTGYFLVSTTLSAALGPFLALSLLDRVGVNALFAANTACCIGAAVTAMLIHVPAAPPLLGQARGRWRLRPSDVLDPAALPVSTIAFVAGTGYSGVLAFLSPYARDIGLAAVGGVFFIVYAGTVMLSRVVVGRVQDTFGDNAAIYPALVALALGLAGLGLAESAFVLLGAGALIGLGFGAVIPSVQAVAVTVAPPERLPFAISTFFILLDTGTGLGPLALGALVPSIGYHGMFATSAALVLGSTVLYHQVHGHRRLIRGSEA